jgi:glutathione S-transferase
VRLCIEEKGLAYEGHVVNLEAMEHHSPEYLKINPNGVIPALIHDGRPLYESGTICEYLDEVFPDHPLRPKDAYGRAQMRIWTKRMDEEIHPSTTPITYAISHRHMVISHGPAVVEEYINKLGPVAAVERRRRIELGVDDEDAQASLKTYVQLFKDLDAVLAHSKWLVGDMFTAADVALGSVLSVALYNKRVTERPLLEAYDRRLSARPAYQRALEANWPPLPPS